MNRRAYILAAILALTLSSMYFLPPFRLTESAMSMEIPKQLGAWKATSYPASEKERKTLAPDTQFSKASCERKRPGSWDFLTGRSETDQADISIVLSGYDLANSIHRPERCMPAQGHQIYHSEKSLLDVPGQKGIPVRQLLSAKKFPLKGSNEEIAVNALTIYFFVGHGVITENHTKRTLIDIEDRLKKGQAQRWAYVSVTMFFKRDGDEAVPALAKLPSLKEANGMTRELLAELVNRNLDWNRIVN